MKLKILIGGILIAMFALQAEAQFISPQVIAAQGAYQQGTNISWSGTMGETFIPTLTNAPGNLMLTQGFQQPGGLNNIDFTYLDTCISSANGVQFLVAGNLPPCNSSITYLWSFGDGATSGLFNPAHRYTSLGNYSVSLTVVDSCSADTVQYIVHSINVNCCDTVRGYVYCPGSACFMDSLTILLGGGNFYRQIVNGIAYPSFTGGMDNTFRVLNTDTPGVYSIEFVIAMDSGFICSDTISLSFISNNCTSTCAIDSANILCSSCVQYDTSGFEHFWTTTFYYEGSNNSIVRFSDAYNLVVASANNTANHGTNSNLVIGADPGLLVADTMTITVIDSATGDSCVQRLPLSLQCDSSNLQQACPSSVVQCNNIQAYNQGLDQWGHHLYMGVFNVNNNSGNSIAISPIQCSSCFNNSGGGGVYPPGTSLDTVYFASADSSDTAVCIYFLVAGQTNYCANCGEEVCFHISNTQCGISNLAASCEEIAPQNNFYEVFWKINYNYSGSSGSRMFVIPNHSFLAGMGNQNVESGSNNSLIILAGLNNQTYSYDTLIVGVVDSLTGDTCTVSLIVSITNDTTFYLQQCVAAVVNISNPRISCNVVDPNSGESGRMVAFTVNNTTANSMVGGIVDCSDCEWYDNQGGFYPPGATADTVYFQPDSLGQDSVHLEYVFADTTFCLHCKKDFAVAAGCAPLCSIDSPYISCSSCIPYDTIGFEHFWTLNFYYEGNNNSTLLVSSVHNTAKSSLNSVVNHGENADLVVGANMNSQGLVADTMIITVIDSATGDTCKVLLPVSLLCDSANNTTTCTPATIQYSNINVFAQGVNVWGQPTYMGVLTVLNNSADTIGTGPVECVSCVNSHGGGGLCPPGISQDTVYFALADTTVTNVCMYFIDVLYPTYCVTCGQQVCFPLHGTCSLDSPLVSCQKTEPQPNFIEYFMKVGFNYSGSGASNFFVTPAHSNLMAVVNTNIQNGYNDMLVFLSDTLNQPFNYDTLILGVIDSAGDTCTLPVIVSLANDSTTYLQSCAGAMVNLADSIITCNALDSNSGQMGISAVFLLNNSSGGTVLGGIVACSDCQWYDGPGGFFPPGTTPNIVYFEPDSATQDSVHITYAFADSSLCPQCKVDIAIALPNNGGITFTAGDTVLCAGDTTCYQATGPGTLPIVYHVSGGATIDSVTGCVGNVTGNFTVTATQGNCLSGSLNVRIQVAPPVVPPVSPACSDSPVVVIVPVIAGNGGNQIEWSTDSTFGSFQTIDTPAAFSITLSPPADTIIWFRSADSASGCASTAVSSELKVHDVPVVSVINYADTINSGDSVKISISSNQPGTSLNWVRNDLNFLSGDIFGSTSNINSVLINNMNYAVTVAYTITGSTDYCVSAPVITTVLVNATPQQPTTMYYDDDPPFNTDTPAQGTLVDRWGYPIQGGGDGARRIESVTINTCSNFKVDYADVDLATGNGFDDQTSVNLPAVHPLCGGTACTVTLGALRQWTYCQVLTYISNNIQIANTTTPLIYVGQSTFNGGSKLATGTPTYTIGAQGLNGGNLHDYITTGIDPAGGAPDGNMVVDFASHFGDSWSSDAFLNVPTGIDLFTVLLHESTHMLGFLSAIKPNGLSSITNTNPGDYSLLDQYLQDGSVNFITTNNYTAPLADITSGVDVYHNVGNSMDFPIYSPTGYAAGSSLSHFDNDRDNQVRIMGPSYQGMNRQWRICEDEVLCNMGYTLIYNWSCGDQFPVAVNDMGNTTFDATATVCIDVTTNDNNPAGNPFGLNTASVTALNVDPLSVTTNGNQICFMPPTGFCGQALISYNDIDNVTGIIGNTGYLIISVPCPGYCPDDPCNLICNGGFEHGISENDPLLVAYNNLPMSSEFGNCPLSSDVDFWCRYTGTPDLFVRNSNRPAWGSNGAGIPINGSAQNGVVSYCQTDPITGIANNRYVDGYTWLTGGCNEAIYNTLVEPLNTAITYDLVFYARSTYGPPIPLTNVNLEYGFTTVIPQFNCPTVQLSVPTYNVNYTTVTGYANSTLPASSADWIQCTAQITPATNGLQYFYLNPHNPTTNNCIMFYDGFRLTRHGDNLSIIAAVDNPNPCPGDIINITYTLRNDGANILNNVVFTPPVLPPGFAMLANNFNNWPLNTIPTIAIGPGGEIAITMQLKVTAGIQYNQGYDFCLTTNAVSSCISPGGCVNVEAIGTDIQVALTQTGCSGAQLTITNGGPMDAQNVVVDVSFGACLTSPSYNVVSGGAIMGGNTATIASLTAGSSAVIDISGFTITTNPCFLTASLSSMAPCDMNNSNNSITIPVYTSSLPAHIAAPASMPCNPPVTLGVVPPILGAVYSWSPSATLSGSNLPNPVADPTVTTTYDVSVTLGTCTVTDNVTVSVTGTAATASNNSPLCSCSTLTLTGGPAGADNYAWTGPNGYHSSLQSPTVSNCATSAMAGVYNLMVTIGSCTYTGSTIVVINQSPAITASSNSPVCTGKPLNLIGGPAGAQTYAWSGPSTYTFSSSSQNPTVNSSATLSMAGNYTLSVTATDGCTASTITNVVINQSPVATASSNSPVCTGQPLDLTGGPAGAQTYAWSGPSTYTFSSSSQSPTVNSNATSSMAGIYTIDVTATDGCTASTTTNVVIKQSPAVTATCNSPVCIGSAINLVGGPPQPETYAWSGPGFSSGLQDPTVTASATLANSGNYTLDVTAPNGCTGSATVNVTVAPPCGTITLTPSTTTLYYNPVTSSWSQFTITVKICNTCTTAQNFSFNYDYASSNFSLVNAPSLTTQGLSYNGAAVWTNSVSIPASGCQVYTLTLKPANGHIGSCPYSSSALTAQATTLLANCPTSTIFSNTLNFTQYSYPVAGSNVGINNVSSAITAGVLLPMTGTSNATNTAQYLVIDGNFDINQNYAFYTGSNVLGSPAAQLTVDHSVTLTSLGTNYQGCAQMWHGIVVDGSGLFTEPGQLNITGGKIADALYGIECFNQSQIGVQGVGFIDCFIGLYFCPLGLATTPSLQLTTPFQGNTFTGTLQLKPGYNGMSTQANQPSATEINSTKCMWAGLHLDNLSSFNCGSFYYATNTFSGLANGIIARNCDLLVVNSGFNRSSNLMPWNTTHYTDVQDGITLDNNAIVSYVNSGGSRGLAIAGFGGRGTNAPATFTGWNQGVVADKFNANSVEVVTSYFHNCNLGIWVSGSQNSEIEILSNQLDGATSDGIALVQNDPVKAMGVEDNWVEVGPGGSGSAYGIIIWESLNPSQLGVEVSNNHVAVHKGYYGLALVTCAGTSIGSGNPYSYVVENNTVIFDNQQSGSAGIYYGGCNYIESSYNLVTGNAPATSSLSPMGFYYNANPAAHFSCDETNSFNTGVRFSGANNGSYLKGCNFGNPSTLAADFNTGLLLDNMATLPPHNTAAGYTYGNKWYGGPGNYLDKMARNNYVPYATSDIFDVKTNIQPYFPANSYTPLGWFVSNSTFPSPYAGCTATVGSWLRELTISVDTALLTVLDSTVINDSLHFDHYNSELKWQNANQLFQKMKNNPSLIEGPGMNAFFVNAENGNIGKLNNVEELQNKAMLPDSNTAANINSLLAHRKFLVSCERSVDSLADITLWRDSAAYYRHAIEAADSLLTTLQQSFAQGRIEAIRQAADANAAIIPSSHIELNHTRLNNIYFETVGQDVDSFNASQLASLYELAFQCPLAGGEAVFRARSLLALVVDTTYDDDALCDTGRWYNLHVTENMVTAVDSGELNIHIYPNPAADYLNIESNVEVETSLNLKIFDYTGNVVKEQPINLATGLYRINTKAMVDGVYLLRLYKENVVDYSAKFVIIHR